MTYTVCRYCLEQHGHLVDCDPTRLRLHIDELQRRLDLVRQAANLYTKHDGEITSYLVTIPYHDWLEAIGDPQCPTTPAPVAREPGDDPSDANDKTDGEARS
jgi:hypothetical protein